ARLVTWDEQIARYGDPGVLAHTVCGECGFGRFGTDGPGGRESGERHSCDEYTRQTLLHSFSFWWVGRPGRAASMARVGEGGLSRWNRTISLTLVAATFGAPPSESATSPRRKLPHLRVLVYLSRNDDVYVGGTSGS